MHRQLDTDFVVGAGFVHKLIPNRFVLGHLKEFYRACRNARKSLRVFADGAHVSPHMACRAVGLGLKSDQHSVAKCANQENKNMFKASFAPR